MLGEEGEGKWWMREVKENRREKEREGTEGECGRGGGRERRKE